MRDTFTPKVIAICNQKGGVGKSTITTLLANIFHFVFNLKIAIIDADDPQHTIYKRHQLEAEHIHQKPVLNTALQNLYQGRAPIMVYPTMIKKASSLLGRIREKYDLIFLDIAGTLDQEHLYKGLAAVHHFFIPVLQDADSLKSSLEFFQFLQQKVIPKSTVFESCHFFLNNLPSMNRANKFRTALQNEGLSILDTSIPHYVVYERGFRSTLLPIPKPEESKQHEKEISKLHELSEEIYLIMQLSDTASKARDEFSKQEALAKEDEDDETQEPSDESNKHLEQPRLSSQV